jgi:alpha-L-rhamnosidase
MDGSIGWADAIVLIPYRYYKIYNDVQIVKQCYPAMKKYAEYAIRRAKKRGITSLFKKNPYHKYTYEIGQHWGEWCEPKDENFEGIMSLVLPRPEEATAYLAYTMSCLSEIADVLGETSDKIRYTQYAQGAKKAYNFLFVKNDDIESSRPAKLVRPLALGLLDEPAKSNVAKRLAKLMEKRGYTVGTGFLSTPFLLGVLSDNGYEETAYKTLLQEKAPGWFYQIKQGATTVWENWEKLDKNGLGSLNHYSKGAVCFWLFNSAAGIKIGGDDTTFILRPLVTDQLNDVKAEYDSIYGKVKSGWVALQDKVDLTFEIPANTTALICMPDGTEYTVGSGEYSYQMKKPASH